MLKFLLILVFGFGVTACSDTDPPSSLRPDAVVESSARSQSSEFAPMAALPRKYYGARLYWRDPPAPPEGYVTVAVNLDGRWGWQNVIKGHRYYDGRNFVRAPGEQSSSSPQR